MPNPAVRPTMRLLSFLLLHLALASGVVAQTSFLRTYALPSTGYFGGAVLTADSDVVVCGNMGDQALLMRLDRAGNLLWSRRTDAAYPGV